MRLILQSLASRLALLCCVLGVLAVPAARAGGQLYTPLSASVRAALQRSVADEAESRLAFPSRYEADYWIGAMSRRLEKTMPNEADRIAFLRTEHYEASRAGLDPELVLGLIEVESRFDKYAVSRQGARGYMQVMPFWVSQIGNKGQDLFQLRVNLRYGCTILRYYLDLEKGDLFRALGRYNGTLGRAEYPRLVRAAWTNHWALARHKTKNYYLSSE
jgi:soluble lytic murein transglycosylase-like protein